MKILICVLTILLLIMVIIINKIKYKKILKLNFLYTVIWSITIISSIINPLGLKPMDDKLGLAIVASTFIFNVLFYILIKDSYNFTSDRECLDENKESYNYRIIYILNIIAFALILPNTIKAISIILSNGFDLSTIRDVVYLGSAAGGSDLQILLTRVIPSGVYGATVLFGANNLSNGKKKLLFMTIFDILVYSLTYGGRLLIFSFVLYYIASLVIMNKKISFKHIKKIKYLIIALVVISFIRFSETVKFTEQIQLYFFSAPSYMSKMLESPSEFGLDQRLWGYVSFSVIIEPIILLFKLLFSSSVKVPTYYLNTYTQPFVNIGEKSIVLINNNCSYFYTFLLDYGYLGVLIGPALFVLLLSRLYKKRTFLSRNLILYFSGVLLMSNMFYKLNGITASITLFIIFICCRKSKRMRSELSGEEKESKTVGSERGDHVLVNKVKE